MYIVAVSGTKNRQQKGPSQDRKFYIPKFHHHKNLLFSSGFTAHPLFSPPRQSLLEVTPMFRSMKRKKKAAIPKQILYTARYPTSTSQFVPKVAALQASLKNGTYK